MKTQLLLFVSFCTLASLCASPSFAFGKKKPPKNSAPTALPSPDPCADVPAVTDALPSPDALPSAVGWGFHAAQCTYDRGRTPSFDQLIGTWTIVGAVNATGYSDGTRVPDAYDPSGIKNPDKSAFDSLVFATTPSTTFDGSSTLQGSVQIQGLGLQTANQGPNVVTINSDRNAACFAQYGYDFLGHEDTTGEEGHYNFECRIVSPSGNKVVCQIEWDASESQGPTAMYFAYIKKGN